MSRTDANTEKAAGPIQNVARPDNLHWDVFVTPGIPIVTRDKPPGVRETFFQARRRRLSMACATFDAHVVNRSKNTGYVECDVTDPDGKLIAKAMSTCTVLRGDHARSADRLLFEACT